MSSFNWPSSGGGSGTVVGPGSSTDNAVARFSGTSGTAIQDSGVIIDDSDNISGVVDLDLSTISVSSATDNRALETGASGEVQSSSVTSTELGFVSGVSSGIQSQFNALSSIITNFAWQPAAIDYITDNTAVPPTEVSGNRYVLSDDGGAPNAAWDGASAGDIVQFNGTTWDATTASVGTYISINDETTSIRLWGGSSWDQKFFESTTASLGLTKVGFDIRLDSSAAGDGLGFTTGVLNVNVDDSSIETSGDSLRVKALGVTSAMLAGSIDATKIADGSISDAEFQKLDGIAGDIVGTTDTQALSNKTLTSPILNVGVSGTAVLDEDDMSSDSSTQLATQQSIKAYVDDNAGGNTTVSAKSADYAVLDGDGISTVLMTTSTTDRTVTLPTASANNGRILKIMKVDSATGLCTIDGEGSETINGKTTVALYAQWDYVTVVCDGTGWLRLDSQWNPVTVAITNTMTSNATTTAKMQRRDNWMYIESQTTFTSTTSGSVKLTIPLSLTAKTGDMANSVSRQNKLGDGVARDNSASAHHIVQVFYDTTTVVRVEVSDASNTSLQANAGTTASAPFTINTNDTIVVKFSVPIDEWA